MEKIAIDVSNLTPEQQAIVEEVRNAFAVSNEKNQPAPEKWTVEKIVGMNVHYPVTVKSYDKDDALKVLAFCQLLTCAHWANSRANDINLTKIPYHWIWTYKTINYPLPVFLKNEAAYDIFMKEITDIEPLLKTFFGINKPT